MSINKTAYFRLEALIKWGESIQEMLNQDDLPFFYKVAQHNSWFTPENTRRMLNEIVSMLDAKSLAPVFSQYKFDEHPQATVGIVMAGNIPAVGFHDLLCVLIAGHRAQVKLSSSDKIIIPELLSLLSPALASQVSLVDRLSNFDAVIATGSDNTARYFEAYFGKYPHIIRKNRTSVALLTGDETTEQLTKLGDDVFAYFGLGCRNVTHLLIPEGYHMPTLLDAWEGYAEVGNHNKYRNNYDYYKSILLVNSDPHFDTGYVLLRPHPSLYAGIAMLHYSSYTSKQEVDNFLRLNQTRIQCVVGAGAYAGVSFVKHGEAQKPNIYDYADGVDTLRFLTGKLNGLSNI